MAREKTARSSSGGRGSKEAIEKRRVARQLNALLTGGSASDKRLDGRTEKRRARLIKELKQGRRGRPLKPIDVVASVNELLDLGETLSSLRKQGVRPRKTELTDDVREVVDKTQKAYGFRAEAWRMLGLQLAPDGSVTQGTARAPRKRTSKKA